MTRLPRLAMLIAGSCLAVATPALAQTQAEDQRFQQAQQRLDSELNVFRTEFDRYQQARARGSRDPRGGYGDPRGGGYVDPRGGGGNYDPRSSDTRYDRDEGGYDASRYYRGGTGYQERVLGTEDRIYRGTDDRYYCRRSDGTTGLIVGAVGGGVLGNVIAGGRSAGVGTVLGVIAGGALGRSVDQNQSQVRCR